MSNKEYLLFLSQSPSETTIVISRKTVRAGFLADRGYYIPEDLQYGERAVVAPAIVNRRFPLIDLDRVLSEQKYFNYYRR